eukprot:scaffold188659_cov30-Tisochrysis_lutea.AAC.5
MLLLGSAIRRMPASLTVGQCGGGKPCEREPVDLVQPDRPRSLPWSPARVELLPPLEAAVPAGLELGCGAHHATCGCPLHAAALNSRWGGGASAPESWRHHGYRTHRTPPAK